MPPRKERAKRKQKYKPARACETCYETVFPLIEDTPSSSPVKPCFPTSSDSTNLERNSGVDGREDEASAEREDKDRISSLRDLPMWVSVSVPSSPSWAAGTNKDGAVSLMKVGPGAAAGRRGSGSAVSYGHRYPGTSAMPRSCVEVRRGLEGAVMVEDGGDGDVVFEEVEDEDELVSIASSSPPRTKISVQNLMSPRENTARKVKRFSLPAGVALQRTSVNVFSGREEEDDPFGGEEGVGSAVSPQVLVGREGERGDAGDEQGRSRKTSLGGAMAAGRRFSLVIFGGRGQVAQGGVSESPSGLCGEEQWTRKKEVGLGKGVAASKLSELLGKKRGQP